MNTDDIDWILVSSDKKANSEDEHELESKRVLFEKKLEREGLIIDRERYGHLICIKLKAPPNVLKKYCEIMKFRMPIREVGLHIVVSIRSEYVHLN